MIALIRTSRQRGLYLIEFSLVIPILVAFLVFMIESGIVLYNMGYMTHVAARAAREAGVRAGAELGNTYTTPSCAAIRNHIMGYTTWSALDAINGVTLKDVQVTSIFPQSLVSVEIEWKIQCGICRFLMPGMTLRTTSTVSLEKGLVCS